VLLGLRRRDRGEDLDLARLELGTYGGKLLVVEVVLERERLEDAFLQRAALLRLVEGGLDRCIKRGRAQFVSHPSVVGLRGAERRLPAQRWKRRPRRWYSATKGVARPPSFKPFA
jgi:hypothetical protein